MKDSRYFTPGELAKLLGISKRKFDSCKSKKTLKAA